MEFLVVLKFMDNYVISIVEDIDLMDELVEMIKVSLMLHVQQMDVPFLVN